MYPVLARSHWSRNLMHRPSINLCQSFQTVGKNIVRSIATQEKMKYGAIVTRSASESPNTPVVAILGWNDAKMRNIQKYSKIFEEKNWTTVCLPATSINTFFRPNSKVKTISTYMFNLLKQLTVKGNPVILYSLSSGGCTVYYYIAKALTTSEDLNYNAFKVIGSIFDSCPVKNTREGIRRLQISMTERVGNPVVRTLIWYSIAVTMPFVVLFNPLLRKLFDELQTFTLNSPEAYFYSKADKLALYQDIDDYIAQRISKGITVFHKRWDDPPHVSHYMKYPEEYLEILEQFLKCCLEQK